MYERDRMIFHIDCNAFYASVAELLRPELREVPMAVCGDPNGRRGIVLAKNELAKSFGVKTAETVWQAKQKCPGLITTPPTHHLYGEYCEKLNVIYETYTNQVERFGIDESYLDVTGSLHLFGGDALGLANEIRLRVRRELGLTVSVGISWCKVFAKLGSDMKKPDAVTLVSRENYRELVWPLPVTALLFVGRSTADGLRLLGVETIGQLAAVDCETLIRRFGKLGAQLHDFANGIDDSRVLFAHENADIHSVGNGMTFRRDLVSRADIRTAVIALSGSVASRMRRAGLKGCTVQVTIKDTKLKAITRQRRLDSPTYLAKDISAAALKIIETSWNIGVPIRMLTVTALKLVDENNATVQISLFDSTEADGCKREKLEKAVDAIRGKYGRSSIAPGSLIDNDLGIDGT